MEYIVHEKKVLLNNMRLDIGCTRQYEVDNAEGGQLPKDHHLSLAEDDSCVLQKTLKLG